MLNEGQQIVHIKGRKAAPHLDSIEGLIFDPQPYPVLGVEDRAKVIFAKPVDRVLADQISANDRQVETLARRYRSLISDRFQELAQGEGDNDLPEAERAGIYDSQLYVVNEKPSLMVGEGKRQYQLDLRLARDWETRMRFAFLHIQQQGLAYVTEANLMMNAAGMLRIGRDGKVPEDQYTPAFAEQQRLIAVHELLSRYMPSI